MESRGGNGIQEIGSLLTLFKGDLGKYGETFEKRGFFGDLCSDGGLVDIERFSVSSSKLD